VSGREGVASLRDEGLFGAIGLRFGFGSSYTSWDATPSLVRSGAVHVEPLTTVFSLDKWEDAFRAVEDREVVKAVP